MEEKEFFLSTRNYKSSPLHYTTFYKKGEKMIFENIKYYAKKRGLTIKEVERRAGIAENGTYKWKNDFSPSLTSLQKVADVLGVSIGTLLKERKE